MKGHATRNAARPWLAALAAATLAGVMILDPSGRAHRAHALQWMREHWLNAIAITAFATLMTSVVTIVLWRLDRRHAMNAHTSRAAGLQAHDRAVILRRVRKSWINGVLEPSLAEAAQLTLGLQGCPEALSLGTRVIRRPARAPVPLPPTTPIVDIFDDASGSLLILGTPGSGKTTLLLQLADALLERAEREAAQPIPVVFNLASWASAQQPLVTWLTGELAASYHVNQDIGESWVSNDALVLLLDGLDEVTERHRAACTKAINAYQHDHGLAGLVVCSRSRELLALDVRPDLEEAVELQPPTSAQIDTYLHSLEAAGTPLAEVRAALTADDALRDLLNTPLMLHVIALAYHGRPAHALHQPGSAAERTERLWAAYIDRMFEQRPPSPQSRYTQQQAVSWLQWLARTLRDGNQTEFHLDHLAEHQLRRIRRRKGHGGVESWQEIRRPLERIIAGQPVEQLHWTWNGFGTLRSRLITGITGGAILLFIADLIAGARAIWLGIAPLILIPLIIILAAEQGLLTTGLRGDLPEPGDSLRLSARNGQFAGLSAGLLVGLIVWLANGTASQPPSVRQYSTVMAAFFGFNAYVIAGLRYGWMACFVHYLDRLDLVLHRKAPWQYVSFLQDMTERLLLYRSGSAYLFVHRLLRDYLADRIDDAGPREIKAIR